MQAFLKQVAAHIKSNYKDFSDVCVVMPNRRAGLYLKKYLAEGIEKPVFAPDIFSIEDFFIKVSGLQLIDPVGLLFTFYEVHQEVEGSKAQSFDDFIRWARTLLSDFNEIDVHLVDAKQLFTYLNEVKAIEKWNPDGQKLTEVEKEYLAFYRSLYSYYHLLREKLEKTNTAYQGMVWRKLAEHPELLNNLGWKHVLFAGFNALTTSEEAIINNLEQVGKAEVLWDADEYYVEDKSQEAGHFLRKHIQKSKKDKFKWIGEEYKDSAKEINVTGVPKNVAQAMFAASIIKKWSDEKGELSQRPHGDSKPNLENTALVLADEGLLVPVLNALPDDMGDFNVTMGFPIKQTNLHQLLVQVIRLYENAERFGKLEEDHVRGFYYFDLIKLFQQPYFSYLCDTSDWVHDIKISNRVFYSPAHIAQMLDRYDFPAAGVFKKIFREISLDPKALIDLLVDLLAYFRDQMIELKKTDPSAADTELEYLYHFSKIFMRLKGLFETHNFVTSIKSLREIFNAIAMMSRVPFYGEPLKGMQLMGVLETRNLDFDKVIMLSVNEGTLPASGIGNSFIPFDIQKQFGLPTFQEKNAVFAYHFYRLLQRTTDVHLIYNTEATDLGGGEKSRFIQQLLQEMPGYNPKIKFEESIESLPAPQAKATIPIVVEKTDNVFQKLLAKAKNGLSPTSLNRYRRCGLQFYLQDIVHLEENEEVEETMEARTIGLIVHETLEKLFEPFKGQQLDNSKLVMIVKNLDTELSASFERQYAMGEIRFGKNKLIYEVIRNFVKSYLSFEKEFLSGLEAKESILTILKLEEELATNITLQGSDIEVRLRGNVDRMDEIDGTVRIIDYKTGMVTPAELTLPDWKDFKVGKKLDKAFQVLMYAWLVWQSSGEENPQYESGVISMRKLSEGFIKFGVRTGWNQRDTEVNHAVLQQFELYLRQTIDGLFDQGIPFEQTEDIEVCERCNFNNLCSRV